MIPLDTPLSPAWARVNGRRSYRTHQTTYVTRVSAGKCEGEAQSIKPENIPALARVNGACGEIGLHHEVSPALARVNVQLADAP